MSQRPPFLPMIETLQSSLRAAVRRWTARLRESTGQPLEPRAAHAVPPPTLEAATESLLDPTPLLSATALPKMIDDVEFRKHVAGQAAHLMALTAATSGPLWSELSKLAWETAAASVLIRRDDSFAVSPRSALGAWALANFLYLFQALRDGGKQPPLKALRAVTQPLEASEQLPQPWTAGDLWVSFSLARTANAAYHAAAAEASAATPQSGETLDLLRLCREAAPLFVRQSTLGKLVEAPRLRTSLAKNAAYRILPGLDTLTADPGASAARRLLTAELAFNLSGKSGSAALGAALRWLEGLRQLPDACRLAAANNVAHFVWELLELDERSSAARSPSSGTPGGLFARLRKDPVIGEEFRRALDDLRNVDASPAAEADGELRERLREVHDCLTCYPQYRDPSVATAPAAVAAAAESASARSGNDPIPLRHPV